MTENTVSEHVSQARAGLVDGSCLALESEMKKV